MEKHRRNCGFTLIETMLVVILLGIASTGVFRILDLSIKRYRVTKERIWKNADISEIYRSFRTLASTGKIIDDIFIEKLNSANLNVKIASVTVRNYNESSVFIKAFLMENGKELPVMFFRNRTEK
ncbi:MAG: type II secretion system protein [Candidatus Riflebacteria bacterium]|nr:type II secretion system protein [Candidatus Riflebacteria bacterium]